MVLSVLPSGRKIVRAYPHTELYRRRVLSVRDSFFNVAGKVGLSRIFSMPDETHVFELQRDRSHLLYFPQKRSFPDSVEELGDMKFPLRSIKVPCDSSRTRGCLVPGRESSRNCDILQSSSPLSPEACSLFPLQPRLSSFLRRRSNPPQGTCLYRNAISPSPPCFVGPTSSSLSL